MNPGGKEEGIRTTNGNDIQLLSYLNSFLPHQESATKETGISRVYCCGSSRALYCPECFALLSDDRLPQSIQDGSLLNSLPFTLDVILDDRRTSATGLHAMVLWNECEKRSRIGGSVSHDVAATQHPSSNHIRRCHKVQLVDIQRKEKLPSYDALNECYLLYPSKSSVPLSSVALGIKRLVVLDCKWTSPQECLHIPQLAHLPMVHLGSPPEKSNYWRWHSAGPGKLSTMEAIYFSAMEVVNELSKHQNKVQYQSMRHVSEEEKSVLLDWMWLFAIQRAATSTTVKREGRPLPFSEAGKAFQRNLRRND